MRGGPSQCPKGPTQVCKSGVLIPVEYLSWRYRERCYLEGNSDDGFSWSYTRRMTTGDKCLRLGK